MTSENFKREYATYLDHWSDEMSGTEVKVTKALERFLERKLKEAIKSTATLSKALRACGVYNRSYFGMGYEKYRYDRMRGIRQAALEHWGVLCVDKAMEERSINVRRLEEGVRETLGITNRWEQ